VLSPDDFTVSLINGQVSNSDAIVQLKDLNNQKNTIQSTLTELDVAIAQSREKIQTTNYSTEVERDADKNALQGLITERASQAKLYSSVVTEIDASAGDNWNQLVFNLPEVVPLVVDGEVVKEDTGTRTLIAGSGTPEAPESGTGEVDLESMGAQFRAHWLGLLGFGAVIAVIIFCGLLLRYGFSTSYEGRSNLLRLRYKLNRRGDQ
jgi:hypothetical protein